MTGGPVPSGPWIAIPRRLTTLMIAAASAVISGQAARNSGDRGR
jgi:hypothetical protein